MSLAFVLFQTGAHGKNTKQHHTPKKGIIKNKPVGWGSLDEFTKSVFF